MKRNIGVVRWFTDTESHDKNYGFIKFLCGGDDLSPDDKIYFRKSDIVSTAPRLNDCVSFNLKSHWQERNINCWRVGKVIVLNWNDLPSEIILSRWNVLNDDNKRTAFVKCFDDLPADKLADIAKNFPPDEIFHDVKDKPTFSEKFPELVESCAVRSQNFNAWARIIFANDLPHEIILTRWNELNDDNKRAAFVKYFDILPVDKLADMAKNLPPDEIFHDVKDKPTFIQKLPAIVEGTAQSQNFNGWAKIILDNDFPPEIILTYWNELNDDNKRAAFVKYFDTLPVDKLADMAKDLPPDEILDAVKDKATFSEKFPELVESCAVRSQNFNAWARIIFANDLPPEIFFASEDELSAIWENVAQSQRFNGWAKIIFDNDFPPEMILSRCDKLNDNNRRTAFAKYFDTLSADKLADLAKNLPPDKILDDVKDKPTFSEKFPEIVKRSDKKFSWAQYLLGNEALFRQINDDDVMIFFMYEAVKRMKDDLNDLTDANYLNRLIKLLKTKIDDFAASPRVKIVYSYICAAFSEKYARQRENAGDTARHEKYLNKRDEFIADADKAFTDIFNGLTKKIKAQADNPAKKFVIPEHAAHLLPPCTDAYFQTCSFCEAVTWSNKKTNFCPRLHRGESPGTSCFRIDPNLELSAEDWSVIELTEKLHLVPLKEYPPEYKFNREFFTKIGGGFNRLNDLLERLKCRECGSYMQADKEHAKWKEIKGINELIYEHFAAFTATTFSCKHAGCSQEGKLVYLSYCWHCHEPIDSRDNPVRIKGYYICNNCGAGYRDFAGDNKYAIYPGTICPSCTKCPTCGGQSFDVTPVDDGKFKLVCECGQIITVSDTLQEITPHKEIKYRKYECSACKHKLEFNSELLDIQLDGKFKPVIWA